MNTFGRLLRLTTWGESHGVAIGAVLDGFPSNFILDLEELQREVARRAPGRSLLTTPRKEADEVQILSGVMNGRTLGSPIAFMISNENTKSKDYSHLEAVYRPGHADYTYQAKYGIREHRGGGRSSARETAMRVVAGAMAKQWLLSRGVEIRAYADAIGAVRHTRGEHMYPYSLDALNRYRDTPLCLPNETLAKAMEEEITNARAEGDSVGGVISCCVFGMPVGIGEPIYDKLEARLASAMLSINATRGFELGDGFAVAACRGSEMNDEMYIDKITAAPAFLSNHAGGTLGGISTGQPLCMRVAFKPTPSISLEQSSVNVHGEELALRVQGRHDPCVVPRAIPVVEAMCALVLMDMMLLNNR